MKIISLADWHLRSALPYLRQDKDFHKTQFDKVKQVIKLCNKHKATLIIPGDLFDSIRTGWTIFNELADQLVQVKAGVIVTGGNHDAANHHKDLTASPLGAFKHIPSITVLDGQMEIEGIVFTGAGWEQPPMDPVEGKKNILIYHVSVYKKSIPFFMEGRAYTPRTLKRKYPGFDYMLVGDIHIPFVKDGVICSGPLLRDTVHLIDYKPRVYLIDTEEDTVEPLFLKVKDNVFGTVKKKEDIDDTEFAKDLDKLISAMKVTTDIPKYDIVCLNLAEEDTEVLDILKEAFDELR